MESSQNVLSFTKGYLFKIASFARQVFTHPRVRKTMLCISFSNVQSIFNYVLLFLILNPSLPGDYHCHLSYINKGTDEAQRRWWPVS
jgi:hypothetical protein